ncbi:MAG: YkgJ family cysteine cluster protein [Polyangiaceae bacterium]
MGEPLTPATKPSALSHLRELDAKIDAFTARVATRYPGELACTAGCSDCCRLELTVTAVEAYRIASAVASLDPAAREVLAARAVDGAPCVALGDDDRCAIYEVRPLVCRSHGVPLRFVEPDEPGRRSLPVIDACEKNFTERADLASLDPACVLDQQTLSATLGAIDALFAEEAGEPRGVRFSLRDVVLAGARGEVGES